MRVSDAQTCVLSLYMLGCCETEKQVRDGENILGEKKGNILQRNKREEKVFCREKVLRCFIPYAERIAWFKKLF